MAKTDQPQVTAIAVDADFDPTLVDRSFDPNSGAVPQPGGVATVHAVNIEDGEVFDAAVAEPEPTQEELDEAARVEAEAAQALVDATAAQAALDAEAAAPTA